MIHYIMPMAGRGSRFNNTGFNYPKPLIEIYGRPFFYWATESIKKFVDIASLTFVVLQEHVDKFDIDNEIKMYYPKAEIVVLPEVTAGAVITSMNGIKDVSDDLPIVFNDCDHLFKSSSFNTFCKNGQFSDTDGILLTFNSDEPKYSFVGKDSDGNITRTAEKEVISNEAICGCYYFRNKKVFLNAAEEYLDKCNYSEYYMSGVYNVIVEKHGIVKSMLTDFHIPFGTPEEYEVAKTNEMYKELV